MGTRNLARVLTLAVIILSCICGAVGTPLAFPAAAEAAFSVSENGTIHVDSNLPNARFSISPGGYSGEAPDDFSDVLPGDYTITWQPVTGYETPSPETKTLSDQPGGGSIRFVGTYTSTPQTGTIVVTANVPGATFNITGAGTYNGGPRTISNAQAGDYSITWNSVAGYNTPAPAGPRTLTAGSTITFDGVYTAIPPQDGTITVNSNPSGATFTISGAASYSGTAPASLPGAPPGSYTITWGAMPGFDTPPAETRDLVAGSGISFTGNYSSVPQIGTISVTANMPGAAFTIEGPARYSGTAPATYADAPAGAYTITWRGLSGMTTPVSQTATLTAGGVISFAGTYVDTIPPAISGVAVTEVTPTSVTIVWTTNENSDSQVEYGLGPAFGFITPVNSALVTSHKVTITGLSPGTWYYYRVTSRDLAGNPMQSGRLDFLTGKDAPPVISSVIVTDISASSMTVKWATDGRSDSQVEYGLTANYGSITTVDSALVFDHSVVVTGLATQTTYHFRVISTDYWGNSGRSLDATATTTDVDAPVISGVAATAITDTSAVIVWFTDAASESSVEYGISTNYGMVSAYDNTMVTSHSVALADLAAQTTYHYKVKSRDASGLWSQTPDYAFTTGIDMGTDPPKILYLTPGEPTSSGATISWSTDELAISQIEYGPTDKYGTSTAPTTDFKTSHVVQLTGLKSGVTYHYRVICTDAAGNRSTSEDGTFNTPMGRAPLPSLPVWAWALVGVAGVLVVGVLVVKNR